MRTTHWIEDRRRAPGGAGLCLGLSPIAGAEPRERESLHPLRRELDMDYVKQVTEHLGDDRLDPEMGSA